jgi:hypothetical protein
MVAGRFFSIVIPTYEMHNMGLDFLRYSFEIFFGQTFKDFEIVISDHSKDDKIETLCKEWSDRLDIIYLRNTLNYGNSSANVNNAISHASGKWVKILFQDDYLASYHSLMEIYKHIEIYNPRWIATGCEHSADGINYYRPFFPKWNKQIVYGKNTISSPSVIAFQNNKDGILFDENLLWLMDVEFYWRKYKKYGKPYFINSINVVNRTWGNRLSDTISKDRKDGEFQIIKKRHHLRWWSIIGN